MAHFEKELMVKEISEHFRNSAGLIIANFGKLSVVEIDSLRRKLEKNSSRLIVTKNTLFKRALSEVNLDEAAQFVEGVTGIAVYKEDPVSVAKTLFNFFKDHRTFKIRGGIIEGELISEQRTKALSELPSKDILRAIVVMRLKSPITGLVGVLSGSIRGLLTVLNQINKQKE